MRPGRIIYVEVEDDMEFRTGKRKKPRSPKLLSTNAKGYTDANEHLRQWHVPRYKSDHRQISLIEKQQYNKEPPAKTNEPPKSIKELDGACELSGGHSQW